jgi:hypothetical protein
MNLGETNQDPRVIPTVIRDEVCFGFASHRLLAAFKRHFDDDFVQVAGQADECFSFHLQRGASLRRALLDINQGQTHAAHIVEGDDGMVHRRLAA